MIKTIAVLGGDKRSLFAARELNDKGFNTRLAGFDNLISYGSLVLTDVSSAVNGADAVLLPVAGVNNGVVSCPFSDSDINIYDLNLDNKLVFAGRTGEIECKKLFNILSYDGFKRANALPTAEGALAVAVESYEDTIFGSRCLVIGYGRIGSALADILANLGADVSVSTRKTGKSIPKRFNVIFTEEIESLNGYDLVFNTADKLIISEKILANTSDDPLIIDLASLPGGVDLDAAGRLGFTALRALALPGKYSPAAAGRIISDTILEILNKEEYICRKQT